GGVGGGVRARRHACRRPAFGVVDGRPQARGLLLMGAALAERPLAAPAEVDLLRFATAGSVDDGKSTLIGRLLYETREILEDQWQAVERASVQKGADYVDLALLTDGLRAEREQGITIDVAYRHFATGRRRF